MPPPAVASRRDVDAVEDGRVRGQLVDGDRHAGSIMPTVVAFTARSADRDGGHEVGAVERDGLLADDSPAACGCPRSATHTGLLERERRPRARRRRRRPRRSRPCSGRPSACSAAARKPGASVLKPMSRPSAVLATVVDRADGLRVRLDLVDERRRASCTAPSRRRPSQSAPRRACRRRRRLRRAPISISS